MDKKKVLHIVGGMGLGGTETMLMNIYREVYKDIQFDFLSYYENDAYYDDEIRKLNGKIIKTQLPRKVGLIKSIKNLCSIIKENNYDVVHAHTLFNSAIAMIAAKICRVKVRITHAHTNKNEINNGIEKKLYIKIMQKLIKIFSTDFIACSHSCGIYLFGNGIEKNNNYKILNNYVDYKKFLNCDDKTSVRKELNIKKDDILVSHIGRCTESKNHKFLIELLEEIIKQDKRVKAILVGDGELKQYIFNEIKKRNLQDNIFLMGIREDIDVILNNSDLFIFPSKFEGLGLVMLEAQACGIPCLVSQAIQSEANLNLGLIKKCNLEQGVRYWSNEFKSIIGVKEKDKEKINDAFSIKGYTLDNILNELTEIYQLN